MTILNFTAFKQFGEKEEEKKFKWKLVNNGIAICSVQSFNLKTLNPE